MEMHRDFSDLLACSTDASAEFVLVGAYALALHGILRATGRTKDLGHIEALGDDGDS